MPSSRPAAGVHCHLSASIDLRRCSPDNYGKGAVLPDTHLQLSGNPGLRSVKSAIHKPSGPHTYCAPGKAKRGRVVRGRHRVQAGGSQGHLGPRTTETPFKPLRIERLACIGNACRSMGRHGRGSAVADAQAQRVRLRPKCAGGDWDVPPCLSRAGAHTGLPKKTSRVHTSLSGKTPEQVNRNHHLPFAFLDRFAWRSHCRWPVSDAGGGVSANSPGTGKFTRGLFLFILT